MSTERKVCPCCGFVRQVENIKICTSFDDIKNIGTSTQLYFSTYKYLSILLGIMAVVYAIYSIATNAIASGAFGNELYSIDIITISLSSKQKNNTPTNENYYYIQCWLGVVVVLIWILVMLGIKYQEIRTSNEYDDDTSSASDYSVVIEGIPLDATQEEVQKELNGYYDAVTDHQKIPEQRKRPFNIVKYNVGKPFYLNEAELNHAAVNEVQKEIAVFQEKFIKWVLERRDRASFSVPKEERLKAYEQFE